MEHAIAHASKDSLVITGISNQYAEVGVRVYISHFNIVQTKVAFDGSITFQ